MTEADESAEHGASRLANGGHTDEADGHEAGPNDDQRARRTGPRRRWLIVAIGLMVMLPVVWLGAMLAFVAWVESHPQQLGDWLGEQLERRVRVAQIEARIEGSQLLIEAGEVGVSGPEGDNTALGFQRLDIRLDPWRALGGLAASRPAGIRAIRVYEASLLVRRDRQGRVSIAGFSAQSGQESRFDLLDGAFDIELVDARVVWQDERASAPLDRLAFDAVNVELRQRRGGLQVSGQMQPSDKLAERLRLSMSVDGDLNSSGWNAFVDIDVKGLDLAVFGSAQHGASQAGANPLSIRGGKGDLSVEQRFVDARFQSARARIDISDLSVGVLDAEPSRIHAIQGELNFAQQPEGQSAPRSQWRLAAPNGLRVETANGTWPAGPWEVQIQRADTGAPPASESLAEAGAGAGAGAERISIRLPGLPVSDVLAFARAAQATTLEELEAKGVVRLDELELGGELVDLQLSLAELDSELPSVTVKAGLRQLRSKPQGDVPGVQLDRAEFVFADNALRLGFNKSALVLDFDGLFPAPLEVERLNGEVLVSNDAHSGVVVSTEDMSVTTASVDARGHAKVWMDTQGAPHADLEFRFSGSDAATVKQYLPNPLIPPLSREWLNAAFLGGRAENGLVRVRGPLRDFPYHNKTGEFLVEFDAFDGKLHFAPGWPVVEQVNGRVRFINERLEVSGQGGQIGALQVGQTHVVVADLDNAYVEVEAKLVADIDKMLALTEQTPIRARFTDLKQLRFAGAGELSLSLGIPVRDREQRVAGELELLSTDLLVPDWGNLLIRDIRGRVYYDADGLRAERLDSKVLGRAARTAIGKRSGKMLISTALAFGLDDLRKPLENTVSNELHSELKKLFDGRSDWQVDLLMPDIAAQPGVSDATYEVQLASDLHGMRIGLPEPLGKTSSETRKFRAAISLKDGEAGPLALRYGEQLRALLALPSGSETALRGELRLADGEPRLPDVPGLAIHARLGEADVQPWIDWVDSLPPMSMPGSANPQRHDADPVTGPSAKGAGQSQAAPANPSLSSVRLRAERLRVSDELELEDADIVARAQGGHGVDGAGDWKIRVASKQMQGDVDYRPAKPNAGKPAQLIMTLDRLYFRGESDTGVPPADAPAVSRRQERRAALADPASFPNLAFLARDVRIGEKELGQLSLTTQARANAVEIRRLAVDAPNFSVVGKGHWQRNALDADGDTEPGSRSTLTLNAVSNDLASALSKLGYADAIASNDARAGAILFWPGEPWAIEPAKLSGNLDVQIGKGELKDVDPGAGRALGLLSITALPGRLGGDFRDLNAKGFAFDTISGHFELRDGKATTENLIMRGVVADVEIVGDVDFARNQYAQTVRVIPQVESTLPTLGALGAGLPAGLVVLIAQKLLDQPINRMVKQEYTISGPIDDPVITPIEQTEIQPDAEPGESAFGDF